LLGDRGDLAHPLADLGTAPGAFNFNRALVREPSRPMQ
jgi:hypothetical protein